MAIKQNNDDSQNKNQQKNHSKNSPNHSNSKDNESDHQRSKESVQENLKKTSIQSPLKKSQSKDLTEKKYSNVTVHPAMIKQQSSSLPITIHELQEKTLNLYLKQFMQINSFQSIQKGKLLIDLVKQAPDSKQVSWIINKSFKLFKSSIPEAVLCSFQFIRELIEIAHYRITETLQQLMLMPIVQIIQHRSHVPYMERGNSYFLSQFYRYGRDQKTNHLLKIGSTFFRMVHEALYVWGTFYFPYSNFSKMLNKLINSTKIRFPQYPNEFKFYSQTRIELFIALQSKNIKIYKKQASSQFKQLDRVIPSENQKNFNKKKLQYQNDIISKQSLIFKQKIQSNFSQKQLNKNELFQNKNVDNKKINNKANESVQARIEKNQVQDPQLQCISLKKIQMPSRDKKVSFSQQYKLEEYKRMKPNKVKAKKGSYFIGKIQRQIFNQNQNQIQGQNKFRIHGLKEVEDALNLIQEIEKVQSIQFKMQKHHNIESTKREQTSKQIISKESLKLDLKKMKQRSQSEVVIKNTPELKAISRTIEQHTFRPTSQQNNISHQQIETKNQSSQQPNTTRIQTTQRERFNLSITEGSEDRIINPIENDKSNRNNDHYLGDQNVMALFLKKEFQNLKTSLIDSIKKDILQTIRQNQVTLSTDLNVINDNQEVKQQKSQHKKHLSLNTEQIKEQHHPTSGRFGPIISSKDIEPSTIAFQFIKKKFSNNKKLRASSKRKRLSILKDLEIHEDIDENNSSHVKENKDTHMKQNYNLNIKENSKENYVDDGVNTDELSYEKLYDQISSLKQKLNLVAINKSTNTKINHPFTTKRENNMIPSKINSNLFFKKPQAIDKIQDQNHKSSLLSSLKSTCNSTRKRSGSKLSQRRSSLETSIFEKAVLKPDNNSHQFHQIFGGRNTLLFNAAINSVNKKRRSVFFC